MHGMGAGSFQGTLVAVGSQPPRCAPGLTLFPLQASGFSGGSIILPLPLPV